MFGQGILKSKEEPPRWICEVVEAIEAEYGFCTDAIVFKSAKSETYNSGCYNLNARALQLYCGREQTVERLWLVLHELAHAAQHLNCPDTLSRRKPGQRRTNRHNDTFWQIATDLFGRYDGVLKYASEHEYKVGRRYISNMNPTKQ